jgi:hypothetical protein
MLLSSFADGANRALDRCYLRCYSCVYRFMVRLRTKKNVLGRLADL